MFTGIWYLITLASEVKKKEGLRLGFIYEKGSKIVQKTAYLTQPE